MSKHILAVGDSFTYGEELADRGQSWPGLVAAALSATVDNQGAPGSGNSSMVRNIIDAVTSSNSPDLILIGWSSAGRIEFADDAGIFDTWPGIQTRMFVNEQPWREDLAGYVSRYHDPKYLYKQFLITVLLIQSFLQTNNIKYIMMTTSSNEYYKNTYLGDFPELTAQIDKRTFLGWPDSGMMEWTRGRPVGPGRHFLDAGHRVVADKVIAKIKELGWA